MEWSSWEYKPRYGYNDVVPLTMGELTGPLVTGTGGCSGSFLIRELTSNGLKGVVTGFSSGVSCLTTFS